MAGSEDYYVVAVLLPKGTDNSKCFDGCPPGSLFIGDEVRQDQVRDEKFWSDWSRATGKALYRAVQSHPDQFKPAEGLITPAMIEAGASVLCGFETEIGSEEFWAEKVYRAMESEA